MRLPDNFPQLLREAGLTVVEIDGWRERGRPASTGGFEPVGSLVHHTGSSDARPGNVDDRQYAEWLAKVGRSDLPPPLAQVSTGRDGTVYVLAAGRANHAGVARAHGSVAAGDGNYLYVGDEAQNNGTEGFKKVQRDAMVTLHAVIHAKVLHTSERALAGHRETSTTGKWDPGALDLDQFRADVAKEMKTMDAKPSREKKPNRVQQANALLAEALTEIRKASKILDDVPEKRGLVHKLDAELEQTIRDLSAVADSLPEK